MVKALNGQPSQIKVRSHSPGFRGRFQNFNRMSRLQSMKRRSKTHCSGPNDDNFSDKTPQQTWFAAKNPTFRLDRGKHLRK
jgi:hypothetical protein